MKIFLKMFFFTFLISSVFLFFSRVVAADSKCENTYETCVSKIYNTCKTSPADNNDCSKNAGKSCVSEFQKCKPNLKDSGSRLDLIKYSYYGPTIDKTLEQVVGGIIQVALTLLGVIFLILTVYGGYKWMMARGDEKEVTAAKDIITRAVIGLIIVMAAYAITVFVVGRLTVAAIA